MNEKNKDSIMTTAIYGNHIENGKDVRVCVGETGSALIISDKDLFIEHLRKDYNKKDRDMIVKQLGLEDWNV